MKTSTRVMITFLLFGGITEVPRAQTSLDAVAAAISEAAASKDPNKCKAVARELQRQLQAKLKAVLQKNQTEVSDQAPQGGNSTTSRTVPDRGQTPAVSRREQEIDIRDAQATINRLEQLASANVQTPAQREALAREVFQAAIQSNTVNVSLNRDLGIPPSGVVERVVDRAATQARIERIENREAWNTFGKGANSITATDGSSPRTSHLETLHIGGPHIFGQSTPPVTVTDYVPIKVDELRSTNARFGSLPQGVVLEGVATGLGKAGRVRYDSRFNALVFDDKAVYFLKTSPSTAAALVQAIDTDGEQQRIGVSIGRILISYGTLPKTSDVASTLFLVDKFLAELIFGEEKDWMRGYHLKDAYEPQKSKNDVSNVAVEFRFSNFRFEIQNEVVQLAGAGFDVKLYPVSKTPAADGGGQPDYDSVNAGRRFPEFEGNAQHLLRNIDYYKLEPIVERAFDFGELAALIRGMKTDGVNLQELANSLKGSPKR